MTDLVEKVARALHDLEWAPCSVPPDFDDLPDEQDYWRDNARAALKAIEVSGFMLIRRKPMTFEEFERAVRQPPPAAQ